MAATRGILSRSIAGATLIGTLALGGCVLAGPTYGTDKRVGEQLIEDLASVTTLRRENVQIDYKPRPGLVPVPDGTSLPAPQESVAKNDAAFQSSPEQLRKQLTEQARASGDSPLRNVDTRSLASQSKSYDPKTGKRIDIRKRAARIGDPNERRILSDPPITYRQAASTAPTGELGVPEYKKERARKALQGKDDRGFLRKLLPF